MYTLYTRPNCGLCEEAKAALRLMQEDYPIHFREVNIEEDEQLHEQYMLMIPVLAQQQDVLLYGKFGYGELLEALIL
ncbi:glutaredoxin family protein [Planococcus maritimus]|uniref:glutaredoxin family protein n=1 Tax=Planococcus maritimus TaxID=192421 RepID=UPI0007987859|nr:glutaredoxin family protein [Planococcus maritimus]KYG57563.1 thiol-disulfide isomerase [Planococcus maritimus]OED31302.1 thiol-disulfide isomerase [Planococcus maritimus]